jgi:hypothetical protein
MREISIVYNTLVRKSSGKVNLGDTDIERKIILKQILEEQGMEG